LTPSGRISSLSHEHTFDLPSNKETARC